MKKDDLSELNREELVDLVYDLMTDDESGKGEANNSTTEKPTLKQVKKEKDRIEYKKKYIQILSRTLAVIVVVAAIAVLASTIFFPVIQVSGNSMSPTLNDGDILVLVKSKDFDRGDICCIAWQNKLLLKRVIGLPDDEISITADGTVYVNGQILDEPYVVDKSVGVTDMQFPYVVPGDTFFVMGDERAISVDSRNSVIGGVNRDQITGKMLFKVWSGSK